MTAKRYFQCSFFLPVLWMTWIVIESRGRNRTNSFFYVPIEILAIGIPYLIFLFTALIKTYKQPLNDVLFIVWFAPPAYSVILFLCISVATFSFDFGFIMSLFGLIIGYFHVLPVIVLYFILKELGLLKQAKPPLRPKDTKSLL